MEACMKPISSGQHHLYNQFLTSNILISFSWVITFDGDETHALLPQGSSPSYPEPHHQLQSVEFCCLVNLKEIIMLNGFNESW